MELLGLIVNDINGNMHKYYFTHELCDHIHQLHPNKVLGISKFRKGILSSSQTIVGMELFIFSGIFKYAQIWKEGHEDFHSDF